MKNWRFFLVLIFFILFSLLIIGRLFFLQILNHDFWKALAQGQQQFLQLQKGQRGEIFLNGQKGKKIVLATNLKGKLVYLSPREIEKKAETARALSEILNLNYDWLLVKTKKDNLFEPVKEKISKEEEEALRKRKLPGVHLAELSFRYYPQGTLASKVIGFLGGDGKGQYGIEGFYDKILQGREGFSERKNNFWQYLISSKKEEKAKKGRDLILTLDYNIQFKAEKLLEKAKENLEIEEGEIIVMDPHSGKIIALANFPNFNPNYYSQVSNLEVFQNSSIQKIFEPGSVFKPITMAAALNEGKISPETKYQDKGFVKIGGYIIYNYDRRVWGERTMTEVLEKSINTGAVFAQSQIDSEIFQDYLKKFGIFEKTGIDLQAETFSENKEFKKGYQINFATASFGQGIEMTSMQLVRAFSAIANGGKLVRPYLVNGQKEKISQPIISQNTAHQLTKMMVSVVENGFGKSAKIPGYFIAGKTGTAQIPFSALGIEKPGYSEKTIQSFLGFAPAFNPQFLILVKLKNPKTKTAEYSAAPIFRELAKYIIDLWQIPPDYELPI